MIDTERFDSHAYVAAGAPAIGLRLDPARAQAVAEALSLVVRIAAPAFAVTPHPDIEPAPIFTP